MIEPLDVAVFIRCLRCGRTDHSAIARYCYNCGTPLPEVKR